VEQKTLAPLTTLVEVEEQQPTTTIKTTLMGGTLSNPPIQPVEN